MVNILKASAGGGLDDCALHRQDEIDNLEPEDLRALTLPTRDATDILLVGKH